jgi:DNA-binding transcriptional LysR family regulator
MNWDDMRIFLSVARSESLSGAAKALRVDPATVGRRIARLEQDMDAILFVKSPQGYVVTDAGERLLAHAEAAEQAMTGAESEVRGTGTGLTGTIRVGAPDGCATYLLPHVTRRIQTKNPGLEVQIVALPRVFNLSKREADMAIGVSRPTAGRLRIQKIADYGLCLAASADYLARHPIASRDDLNAHPVVGYIPDMIFDRELDYLSEMGLSRIDFASNLVSVQLGWLRSGAGVGVVHDFVLPDAPELRPVFADTLRLSRTFWLIRHADDARVERLNRFARALTDELRTEIAQRTRA